MRYTFLFFAAFASVMPAFANPALQSERDSLAAQLAGLRSENIRCKKQQTGWQVATVVGSVGVVATGAGAIYQGVQWKKENDALEAAKTDLQNVNTQIQGHATTAPAAGGTQ